MIMQIADMILNPQLVIVVLIGFATFATVLTLIGPMVTGNKLKGRMKSVSTERDKLRAQRMAELSSDKTSLRHERKGFSTEVVEALHLDKILDPEAAREKLKRAGLRGTKPLMTLMVSQIGAPLVFGFGSYLYLRFVNDMGHTPTVHLAIAVVAALFGYYLPSIMVSNIISKRQLSITQAFPDALDLLLICVQSGMSIEAAFKLVSSEISGQSIPLAEELTLTTAEMSYLSDRRQAFENLGTRSGLESVKAVTTSLMQAERYGTPLSQALRVMAQENRDARMAEAERKAHALPPKLTVPMVLFFLPVLFVIIIGPAAIQVSKVM